MPPANRLQDIYQRLYGHYGPQRWWPADSPLEVLVGAVLTQNTNWTNVSRAITSLKTANLLSFTVLEAVPVETLAEAVRSSGYYNQKAIRLKNLLAHIRRYCGDSLPDDELLTAFFDNDPATLRRSLLEVKGIGPETADSILLYAAHKPVFVVDAYTYRILLRHDLCPEETDYNALQELFVDALPEDVALFNEYHALLVRTGKEFCKKGKPLCRECPLNGA